MTALARLRDYAGCRAVLHDAQEEPRSPEVIAELERVMREAEAALWDGGEVDVPERTSARRPPRFRRGMPAIFHPSEWRERQAWIRRRREVQRAELVACLSRRDWLAWQEGTRLPRMPPSPLGTLIDGNGFDSVYRELYDALPAEPQGLEAWLPEREAPVLTIRRLADRATDVAQGQPRAFYVSPRTFDDLRARVRARVLDELINGAPRPDTATGTSPAPSRSRSAADLRNWPRTLVPSSGRDPSDGVEVRCLYSHRIVTSASPPVPLSEPPDDR